MALSIDSRNSVRAIFDHLISLDCPHCRVHSHLTPISIPRFELLARFKPDYVGIVYRCNACNNPVFLRFPVKSYEQDRVVFGTDYDELERAPEEFDFTYLSEPIELEFDEALICYSNSCFNAFASMCRRTVQTVFKELGDDGKLRVFDQVNEIKEIAELDEATFGAIRKILFDTDEDGKPNIPRVDVDEAVVLLEVLKDVLYQLYIRRERIRESLRRRRRQIQRRERPEPASEPDPDPSEQTNPHLTIDIDPDF